MQDIDKIAGVDALIDRATQLHSPPEVARSLLNLTRENDFDVREIVDCIRRDPAMSARMLQVVNSARHGLRTPVTNLNHAIPLLGQRTVRLIAMTFSIFDTFTSGPAKTLYNDFWRSALTMACGASRVAAEAGSEPQLDRHDVYTAALLADVGSLVMAQTAGDTYLELYQQHRGADLSRVEADRFGFDHTVVGARMLARWEFPSVTLEAIRRHHDDAVTDPLAVATRTGALLSDALWLKGPDHVNACRCWLAAHYGIGVDGFTDLALEIRDEVSLEMEIYGVNAGPDLDCRAILEEARRQYLNSSLSAAMDLDSFESVIGGH